MANAAEFPTHLYRQTIRALRNGAAASPPPAARPAARPA